VHDSLVRQPADWFQPLTKSFVKPQEKVEINLITAANLGLTANLIFKNLLITSPYQ